LNLIFELNYSIFSVFAALLLTEIMGSVLLLFFFDQTRKSILQYAVPIWEVTGTFGAYWVVSSYFAYPTLLIPVASIFAGLLIVFLILFVARNSSIVFGEFIIKKGWLDERKLYQTYAGSTLVLGIVVLILLSALVSGAGVNLTADTFSLGAWTSSPGSLVFVLGTLVLGIGLAPVFFDLKSLKKWVLPLGLAGIVLSLGSFYLYSSSLMTVGLLLPTVLTIIAALLFTLSDITAKIVSNKAVFITLLSVIIFSLQVLIYPSALGHTLKIDAVTTSGPVASEYLVLSAVGAVFVGVLLVFYIFIAMQQKKMSRAVPESSLKGRGASRAKN
jgi:cytochrome bd ubiquinol oxidase subunit II